VQRLRSCGAHPATSWLIFFKEILGVDAAGRGSMRMSVAVSQDFLL